MKNLIVICSLIIPFQVLNGQCETNTHTPFFQDGWLSCEQSENPNEVRSTSHWVQFDLGYQYTLDTIYLWNYNFWGYEDLSVKRLAIDHSVDGLIWQSAGEYELERASGSHKYQGKVGPILNQVQARYVLFTVLENWDSELPCAGLAEVKFHINDQTTSMVDGSRINDSAIALSPNPARSMLQISMRDLNSPESIYLVDVNGQQLNQVVWNGIGNQELDIDRLVAGIYFLQFHFGENLITKRFIKID